MTQSAYQEGKKHCTRCGICCKAAPCLVEPADVDRIAAHLGMASEELVATKLDVIPVHALNKAAVRPKRNERGCIFLRGNDCGINKVKPAGGRDFECWTPQDNGERFLWTPDSLSKIGVVVTCQ